MQLPYKVYQNRSKTHAYQIRVVITLYAVILMERLRALVYRIILASRQIASPSAPLTKIVHPIKPAWIWSVGILVLEAVDKMHNVQCLIIRRPVPALKDSQEIPSQDVL